MSDSVTATIEPKETAPQPAAVTATVAEAGAPAPKVTTPTEAPAGSPTTAKTPTAEERLAAGLDELRRPDVAEAPTPPSAKTAAQPETPPQAAPAGQEFEEMPAAPPSGADAPEFYRKWLERYKALKDRARELEASATQPAPAGPQAPAEPAYTAEQLLGFLGQIEAGALDEKYRPAIEDRLENATDPAEIAAVIAKARRREYGEASGDIETAARELLPLAQAGYAREQARRQAQGERQAAQAASWDAVLKEFPDLGKRDPGVMGEFKAAAETLSETFGMRNVFEELANGPAVVAEFVKLSRKAAKADAAEKEIAARDKELAALRARTAELSGGLPPGGRPPAGAGQNAEDKLRAGLNQLGLRV